MFDLRPYEVMVERCLGTGPYRIAMIQVRL